MFNKLKNPMLILLVILVISIPAVSANDSINDDSLYKDVSSFYSDVRVNYLTTDIAQEEDNVNNLKEVSNLGADLNNSIISSSSGDNYTEDEVYTTKFSSFSLGITTYENQIIDDVNSINKIDSYLYPVYNNDEYLDSIELLSSQNIDSMNLNDGEGLTDPIITNNPYTDNSVDATYKNEPYQEKPTSNIEISWDVSEWYSDGMVTFYINLNEDATGMGTFTYDGKSLPIRVTNGKATVYVTGLLAGENLISVKFDGSDIYGASSAYATLNLAKYGSSITVNGDMTYQYGDKFDFTITINPAYDGYVDVNICGRNVDKNYIFPVENGVVKYNFDDIMFVEGEYDLTVYYPGNEKTEAASETVPITIQRFDSAMNVDLDNSKYTYGDDIKVSITMDKGVSGTAYLEICNGELHDVVPVNIVNGIGSCLIDTPEVGDYTITASFNGDGLYAPVSASNKFSVSKGDYDLNVKSHEGAYGEDIYLNITACACGSIDVYLNGVLYTTIYMDDQSVVTGYMLSISDELPSDYVIDVVFKGDSRYNSDSAQCSFVISKGNPAFEVSILPNEDGSAMVVVRSSSNATGEITFTMDNVSKTLPLTDGGVSFLIGKLLKGSHYFTLDYKGDANYNPDDLNGTFVVGGGTSLAADNLTMYYQNGSRFEVNLTFNERPLVGEEVIIEINGVNYTRTTSEDGIASVGINLAPGSYDATVYYRNQSTTATISVLPTVISKDLTKYYQNGSQFTVCLLDKQGNPLANRTVIFNINGVFYTRTSNADGFATLNINLGPGSYTITAIGPDGVQVSNDVTVLSTVITTDLTKYYKNDSQYKIKIVDDEGNPVEGRDISININGVFYYRTTDENGIATLNINLNPGTYIATVEDLITGLKKSNTVKVLEVPAGKLAKAYDN